MPPGEKSQSLAVTDEGSFFYDSNDNSIGKALASKGIWDINEVRFIKKIVGDGDRVIDIGANIGWNTVIFGKLTGENGTVLAYEPDPNNFELLCENIKLNKIEKQTKAYKLALLDKNRNIELGMLPGHSTESRLRLDNLDIKLFPLDKILFTTVEGLTLDSALAEESKAPKEIRLLKIDCPGSEVNILSGAYNTLARTEFLIVGCKPSLLAQSKISTDEFSRILKEHFTHAAIIDEQVIFKPIESLSGHLQEDLAINKWTNYVFRRLP